MAAAADQRWADAWSRRTDCIHVVIEDNRAYIKSKKYKNLTISSIAYTLQAPSLSAAEEEEETKTGASLERPAAAAIEDEWVAAAVCRRD